MHPGKGIALGILLTACSVRVEAQLSPWWAQDTPDSTAIRQDALADSIVSYAKTFIGIPYVWGGSAPAVGFDCSGFICYVYKAFDIELPRTSGMQFDAGKPVPHVDAAPGDIIVFSGPKDKPGDPGHVGIVLDYDLEKASLSSIPPHPKQGACASAMKNRKRITVNTFWRYAA